MTPTDTSLSTSQVQVIRQTLEMARDVLDDEGYENAVIQCRMALRALNEAEGVKAND